MTDNRTTELREKLDEAGIEYEICDMPSNAQTYWGDWCFMEPLDAKPHTLGAQCELTLIPATPEQAIAATLGSEREKALEELVRDAYWLIVRAIWSHESQDKFAADWTERVSVLGIEVD